MILMLILVALILFVKYEPYFEYIEKEDMYVMWYNSNGKFGEKKRKEIILYYGEIKIISL